MKKIANMNWFKITEVIIIFVLLVSCSRVTQSEWRPLFNGKNLDGWDIKIRHHELNDNYKNTFRVEDSLLKVSYDEYDDFGTKMGFIFYNEPFSHYILRVEYRFVGEQIPGRASRFRNSGILFHSRSAESMELDQDIPVSFEATLLGGDGERERRTLGVCNIGTYVMIDGVLRDKCIGSRSKTYHLDQWVTVELHVYGDSIVHHVIENDTVLTYHSLQLSETGTPDWWLTQSWWQNSHGDIPDTIPIHKRPLKKGYIALQSEGHPIEFRKVEILDLSDKY